MPFLGANHGPFFTLDPAKLTIKSRQFDIKNFTEYPTDTIQRLLCLLISSAFLSVACRFWNSSGWFFSFDSHWTLLIERHLFSHWTSVSLQALGRLNSSLCNPKIVEKPKEASSSAFCNWGSVTKLTTLLRFSRLLRSSTVFLNENSSFSKLVFQGVSLLQVSGLKPNSMPACSCDVRIKQELFFGFFFL